MTVEQEWLKYIDHLQRANADDLAFYPLTTLEKALEERHILTVEENGTPAGYLWFGAVRAGYDVTIYQACIDYDLRRHHLGLKLLGDLEGISRSAGATAIRLKCASSALSNVFWQTAGFQCTRVSTGGIKRGRDLNHYRRDLAASLLVAPTAVPSERPINLTNYHALKRAGVAMPSSWSRTHY